MLRTSKWFVAAAVVLLAGQVGYADFIADLSAVSSAGTSINPSVTSQFALTLKSTSLTLPDSSGIFQIELNLDASSANLKSWLPSNATWAWNPSISSVLYKGVQDSLTISPLVLDRQGDVFTVGSPPVQVISDVSPATLGTGIDLGTITINTAGMAQGTYTLSLAGGTLGVNSTMLSNSNGSTAFVGFANDGNGDQIPGGLTLHDFSFNIVPEPATLAFLSLGGLLAIIRRRSR